MTDYLLYVLPFKNEKHFKFGISRQKKLERIKDLHNIYEIDIDKSFFYTGSKEVITFIECELKKFESLEIDDYYGIAGYTEIRNISELEKTIKIIESYDKEIIRQDLKNYINCFRYTKHDPQKKLKAKKRLSVDLPNSDLYLTDFEDFDIPFK